MQQLNRKLFIHLHPGEVETTDAHIFSENSTTANLFRNERRIGVLCQKFVMIFLVSLKVYIFPPSTTVLQFTVVQ